MMKTKFFYVAALILGLAFTTTSCSSDDDNPTVDPANIDYTPENASSWHNYMRNVAALLKTDATNLYNAWNSSYKGGDSYASLFKAHNGSPYASALSCVEEIVDKCAEIANEVGTAKIGDAFLVRHNMNHRIGGHRAELITVSIFKADHIAGKFNDGKLHAKTQAKIRNLLFSGVTNGTDHSFDTAVTESARNDDSIHISEKFVNIIIADQFGIHPFDLNLGIVGNSAML